ncbi:MAG: PfkB family carbohydrate kinase [Chloroflexota bacterium]|nr:PfkB family carbohydrate kinase [Chloroflexota bacterium]
MAGVPPTRPRLLTIGDLTLDIVVRQSAAIESGTDVPAQISFRAGGSAANTARAFARLGGAATFVGAVGDDRLGEVLERALRSEDVTPRLVRNKGQTARLVVSLGANGERSFLTDRGTADSLRWQPTLPALLKATDALHLPAYSLLKKPLAETCLRAARVARRAGALVSVDLASRRPLLAGGSVAARATIAAVKADVLFANHAEAAALVGPRNLRQLLELAPIVVVKAGAAGCTVLWRDVEMEIAARPFKASDTTGAGDGFDAGFMYSLISTGRAPGALRRLDLRHAAYDGGKAAAAFIRGPRAELVL